VLPHRFEKSDYCKVKRADSGELKRLLKLWTSLETFPVWSRTVEAAEREDYVALTDFLYLFAVL